MKQKIVIKKRPARAGQSGESTTMTIVTETVRLEAASAEDRVASAEVAVAEAASAEVAVAEAASAEDATSSAEGVVGAGAATAGSAGDAAGAASAWTRPFFPAPADRPSVPNVYHGEIHRKILLVRTMDVFSEVCQAQALSKARPDAPSWTVGPLLTWFWDRFRVP